MAEGANVNGAAVTKFNRAIIVMVVACGGREV